jgi:hypothetical protein
MPSDSGTRGRNVPRDYLPVNTNGRRLKVNHGNATPQNLLFFDTETEPHVDPSNPRVKLHRIRLWSASHVTLKTGREPIVRKYEGFSPDGLWELIEEKQKPREPLWVFAHNLSFDLTASDFWDLLDRGEYSVGPVGGNGTDPRVRGKRPFKGYLVLEGKPTFATVLGRIGKVHFVDTLNYMSYSLRDMGRSFGLDKYPMPDFAEDDETWFRYCARDVEIIQTAMISLIQEWRKGKCGVWAKTAASLAMNSYRHIQVKDQWEKNAPIIHVARDEDCEDVERAAYYGGRIEPFFMGTMKGPIYHLDVNSLYPSVMASEMYPTKRIGRLKDISIERLHNECSKHCVVAVVDIESDCDTYPLRENGKILRPVGSYRTTLATPELLHALSHGNVRRCHNAIIYECGYVFAEWVRHWYNIKVSATDEGESGVSRRNVAKMILNSLSGKWAQSGKKWKTVFKGKCRQRWGGWVEWSEEHSAAIECRGVAGVRQERFAADPPSHYFPAISAHITAAGRERMRHLMNLVPPRSILYTATDSILCTQEGFDTLERMGEIDKSALGKLSVRGIHTECEVCGPNWYRLDETWIRSGNHGKGYAGIDGRWYYEMFSSATDVISRKPDGTIRVVAIPLKATTPHCSGIVGPDGWVSAIRRLEEAPF